jgi:hypothetical protein
VRFLDLQALISVSGIGVSPSAFEIFKTGVLNLRYGSAESTGDATYENVKVYLAQPEQ